MKTHSKLLLGLALAGGLTATSLPFLPAAYGTERPSLFPNSSAEDVPFIWDASHIAASMVADVECGIDWASDWVFRDAGRLSEHYNLETDLIIDISSVLADRLRARMSPEAVAEFCTTYVRAAGDPT